MGGLAGISSGYGLQGWLQAFDRSAYAVSASSVLATSSQAGGNSADPTSSATPDLVDGLVGSDLASVGAKASIAALRTADQMLGTLIDLRA